MSDLIIESSAPASDGLVAPYVGEQLTAILGNVVVFIAPAVLVVALKSLFETAKD